VENEAEWERNARWWQREFTAGADPEYTELILPMVGRHLSGARRVLDVGCGEGQVARQVAGAGATVTGLDPAWSQVSEARRRAGGPRYARARAEALPCRDAAFDAVVICAALEHVDAYETAIAEVARVLEPDGTLVLVLCHPLLQAPGSGWVDDRILGEQYFRIGSYLRADRRFDEAAPGVHLLFHHRPLSAYVHALGAAGLVVTDMEEPAPPAQLLAEHWDYPDAATIPRVMLVRARRDRRAPT
jgi:SAM-dependent methyltransferase